MLTILYGSQTGTAEEVALDRIARESYTLGYPYQVLAMDELPFTRLPTLQLAIFICSTTGEGEEPDNMKSFWRSLRRKDLPSTFLRGLHVAVFGLGDSSYEQFNFAGKRLWRRLEQLGAEPLVPRGDGDEQHPLGFEGALGPWLESLWAQTAKLAGTYKWEVTPNPTLLSKALLLKLDHLSEPIMPSPVRNSKLIFNKRISEFDQDVKDVRHLSFECDLDYVPGDVAVVRPENSQEEVDKAIKAFNWSELKGITFNMKPQHPSFRPPHDCPSQLTLEHLLLSFLDLRKPPSRYFFQVLSMFIDGSHPPAEIHREKLDELGADRSEAGTASYLDYVWRPKRTPAEVIADFPSVNVPVDWIFDLLPWIKPRSFSIASYEPGRNIDLVVALVRYRTIMKDDRLGLCSSWFESMQPGTMLNMTVNRGSMHLPLSPETPIVLMCSGTGIAPMLSILAKISKQATRPPVYLFFGCRKRSSDALFIDHLSTHASWLTVFCVGSRDGIKGVAKVYLQDILRQHGELVSGLLMTPGSQWFLSGNSKLPAAAKKALAEVVSANFDIDGDALLKQVINSNRFHSETWS